MTEAISGIQLFDPVFDLRARGWRSIADAGDRPEAVASKGAQATPQHIKKLDGGLRSCMKENDGKTVQSDGAGPRDGCLTNDEAAN